MLEQKVSFFFFFIEKKNNLRITNPDNIKMNENIIIFSIEFYLN
jgi:hypothetical protein